MSVATIPDVMQDMADSHYRQQVYIVAETQMHTAPWLFEDEGWEKSRLKAAIELVCTGKVTQTADGWEVTGSGKATYAMPRDTLACPCKAAQHARKSSVCKHRVAVELARRVQQAYPQETPLPLPPVTVEERLAQAASVARDHVFDPLPVPEEDRMPADESMPEPATDEAPVAVLEAPEVPIKIPREYTVTIQGRQHVLYTGLVHAARANGLLTLAADWTYNDAELSLAHAVCTFQDGRRYEESGDATPGNVSKGIAKHFRRVALTRAKARCLRDALGISECSVEEMEDQPHVPDMQAPPSAPARTTSADLRQRIWAMVQAQAPEVRTREAVEAWVHQETGYALQADHYADIVESLSRRA